MAAAAPSRRPIRGFAVTLAASLVTLVGVGFLGEALDTGDPAGPPAALRWAFGGIMAAALLGLLVAVVPVSIRSVVVASEHAGAPPSAWARWLATHEVTARWVVWTVWLLGFLVALPAILADLASTPGP